MTYRLIVLTDGRGLLAGTLASFAAHVSPAPAEVYIHGDGEAGVREAYDAAAHFGPALSPNWTVGGTTERQGFCSAVAECWEEAGQPGPGFVYWLEDDFLHTRDVDLRELAWVLAHDAELAQIALCRGPANEHEERAGGLVASRPDEYQQETAWFDKFNGPPEDLRSSHELVERPWLRHRSYWTTNPSLFRKALAAAHPWPAVPKCEGLFGASLRQIGFSFGLWGSGEPWVDHVGHRQGKGY